MNLDFKLREVRMNKYPIIENILKEIEINFFKELRTKDSVDRFLLKLEELGLIKTQAQKRELLVELIKAVESENRSDLQQLSMEYKITRDVKSDLRRMGLIL